MTSSSEIEEKELHRLLLLPQTRRGALEQVVRQYRQQLYWTVRRVVISHDDADDIIQNVWLKAWKNLDHFRQDAHISTWLYRIAVNESLDFLRKKKLQTIFDADDLAGITERLVADNYFDGDHTQQLLQQAIAQLPDVQRMVFTLRYYDEMKYSEMSKLLNTSEGALKASYHIAVKKITDFFNKQN